MYYYQFNIGDYVKSTRHLSLLEDIAYRRLLDLCYDTEKPLGSDVDKIARLIGMRDHIKETQQILDEYFNLTKNGYIQKRVKREIDAYSAKADSSRKNGRLGGRPRITQQVNLANPDLTQPKAKQEPLTINHKPITNNQEPIKKKGVKRFTPPSLDEIKSYLLEKQYDIDGQYFIDFYDSKGWMIGKNKMKDWKATIRGWHSRNKKGNQNGQNRKLTQCEQITENERIADQWLRDQGITPDTNGENMERVINPI